MNYSQTLAESVTVRTQEKFYSYPIFVSKDFSDIGALLRDKKWFLIADHQAFAHHGAKLKEALGDAILVTLELDTSEQLKSFDGLIYLLSQFNNAGLHRGHGVLTFGGGVISDLSGLAASIYMRGLDVVHVPTTLLAQIDAAIGGKTSINFDGFKNLVGSIYHPSAVYSDVSLLQSQGKRDYCAGLAELLKYGLICDKALLDWSKSHVELIMHRDAGTLVQLVSRASKIKAKFVAKDEQDQGARLLLNLGHTFAHALEACTEFKHCLHGEAVALGLVAAGYVSVLHGWLSMEALGYIEDLLKCFGLPVRIDTPLQCQDMYHAMHRDKKRRQTLRLVLLKEIGQAVLVDKYEPHFVIEALAYIGGRE